MIAKLLRAVVFIGTPLWVTTFREPVSTGRLRLDGLSWAERVMARVGIVFLVLLLGSVMFTEVWRRGDLSPLEVEDPTFVPDGLVPITLTATLLAVALVVWGALDASPVVRLALAGVYVVLASPLGFSTVFAANQSWWLRHGETVLRVGFWTPVGLLVLSALLSWLPARVTARLTWTTALFRGLTLVALGGIAVAQLRMDVAADRSGVNGSVQTLLHAAFQSFNGLLLPLTFIAAVAVVDFATDVSSSVAEPVRRADRRWARLLAAGLVAVIAVKLWSALWRHRDFWSTLVTQQPASIVRTMAVILLIGGVATYVFRTVPAATSEGDVDEAKERLTLGGAVVLPLATLILFVLLGLGQFVLYLSADDWALRPSDAFPLDTLDDLIPILASVLAIVVGALLIRRGTRRMSVSRARELGSGLLLLGAWNLPAWIDAATDYSWGFSYPVIDLAVTLSVLAWLLVRWRRVGPAEVAVLLAVVVFSWLVISRGDYISYAGGLLGLPSVVVVVFGILYTLLSGAAFTTESSTRLPREARTLVFVGYLLLSVTILHWFEVIHQPTSELFGETGFYFLGLPIAVWLLVRRVIPRQLAEPAPEGPPPEEAGIAVAAGT